MYGIHRVQILTKVVATESGKTDAVMANAAVVAAEAPSASTMRMVNDRAMNSTCSVTRSSSLKYEYASHTNQLSNSHHTHF
jgi:hypothetical protein